MLTQTQTTYTILRNALVKRRQVTCFYHGLYRECCPHAIGTTRGIPRVFMYQFDGLSSEGLPPGGDWRGMNIAEMSQIHVRDGQWHTKNRHTKRQTFIRDVDVDVTMV